MDEIREHIRAFLLNSYRHFIRTVGYSGKPSSRNLFRLVQYAAYVILTVLIINLVVLKSGWKDFGQFGDFFGGILNPILTFLMLIGLIITIMIQRVELRLAREEYKRAADALNEQAEIAKKQSFEHTFFQMMRLYNEIIDSLVIPLPSGLSSGVLTTNSQGRDGIEALYNIWKTEYAICIVRGDHDCSLPNAINIEYQKFYSRYGNYLGHYFRTIYNTVKLVEQSGLPEQEKKVYTNILRSQLSKFELGLLLYNCHSRYGNERFLPLVNRYNLLKHLESEIFEDIRHLELARDG